MLLVIVRALVLLGFLLLVPATAADASTAASKHAKATLVGCDTTADTALFRGAITTYGKAATLQLRFTLQARVSGGGGFKRVVAPTFDTWLSYTPGKRTYVYDKTVENLEDGAAYRAVVRFRWRDADGDVIARATKATAACTQPDDRPNLKVTDVTVTPGTTPATRTYVVKLVNRGRSPAPVFATGLTVNAVALPDQLTAAPLLAGASTTVSFIGPRCDAGSTLTATADSGATVDERNETDNVLAVACPAGRRRNGRAAP